MQKFDCFMRAVWDVIRALIITNGFIIVMISVTDLTNWIRANDHKIEATAIIFLMSMTFSSYHARKEN